MTEAERILTDAQNRIRDISNFTQHTSARSWDDRPVTPLDDRACKFCGAGTMFVSQQSVSYGDLKFSNSILARAADRLHRDAVGGAVTSIIEVNDLGDIEVAHGRVMQVFDLARDMAAGRVV